MFEQQNEYEQQPYYMAQQPPPQQQPPQQQEQEEVANKKPKRGRAAAGGQPKAPQQHQQEAPPPDLDAEMEAMIKEMQLFNLYKTQPPMLAFILCKEDRQTLFFDRQKVRLVGNDQVELRFKMCALCRKGNLELKKLYAAYWPYRP